MMIEIDGASGAGAMPTRRLLATAIAGAALAGTIAGRADAQIVAADTAAMNLALNLQYWCGQYLYLGLFGNPLDPAQTRGFGLGGTLTGAITGGRKVTFSDRTIELPLQEIADETLRNITVLRGILRGDLVAQPPLDISVAAFTAFMRSAGAIGSADSFDPYASSDTFLLGAFLICDTMVTAYRGLLPTIVDPLILTTMSGLLTTRAAHAAVVRQMLYRRSVAVPGLITLAQQISDYRDRLDGASERDQGITPSDVGGRTVSNITSADPNGETFGRSGAEVLNILYASSSAVTRGGFFPQGVTGTITTSAAN